MRKVIYTHKVYAHDKKFYIARGTLCAVRDVYGHVWVGSSICSIKDQFVKKVGRELAYKRAMDKEGVQEQVPSHTKERFLLQIVKTFRDVPYYKIHF
jgi:hypothetical protein